MPLSKEDKDKLIKKFRVHDSDTGSSEVQIAILSAEIDQLTGHLKQHKHDYSSRKGLIGQEQERRRLLQYMKRENLPSFEKLVKALKLKGTAESIAEVPEERP